MVGALTLPARWSHLWNLSRWVWSTKGREHLPCVFPFSASAHRGRQLSPSNFSINLFLAPPHKLTFIEPHVSSGQGHDRERWCPSSWMRALPSHTGTFLRPPKPPPCACTQGHIPCSLWPRALHLRQGCPAGLAFLLAIGSRPLTNHWLATWTWSLLCVMCGWVGGRKRNLYWGVQSYCTGEGS